MVYALQGLTLDQFLQLPEDKPALEYFDGEVAQKVAPTRRHSRLQYQVCKWVNDSAEPHRLAVAYPELRTTFAGSSLVPDVAVYRWARNPVDAGGAVTDAPAEAPDVAIEIVSPDQSVARLGRKCQWYVEHGVPLALIVNHLNKSVRVFRPGLPAATLRDADIVDFSPVLPDLQLSVVALFALLKLG